MPEAVIDPDGVTADWLDAVLRDAGVLGEGVVTGVTVEPLGEGLVGHNLRVVLTTEGTPSDAPVTIVAKFPSLDPASRAAGQALGNYEREVRFYRELATGLPMRVPRCFHAGHDPGTGGSTILLEDLAPAEAGDQVKGCDPEAARAALMELARLHAARWAEPLLDEFAYLNRLRGPTAGLVQGLYQSMWPRFVELQDGLLSPDHLDLGERIGAALAESYDALGQPFTLVHGDYRLDNLLFGVDGRSDGVAAVDWQSPGHGPPGPDLAYFLTTGLEPEIRRDHERDLVAHYADALAAEGVIDYDAERAFADYRAAVFAGITTTVVASAMVTMDARGREMFEAMARRQFTAAAELDVGALLP